MARRIFPIYAVRLHAVTPVLLSSALLALGRQKFVRHRQKKMQSTCERVSHESTQRCSGLRMGLTHVRGSQKENRAHVTGRVWRPASSRLTSGFASHEGLEKKRKNYRARMHAALPGENAVAQKNK